ncbi:MAG: hypothetical protein HZA61_01210 [Candidatus Eisenbacteria bacterium]|uniref:Uncharacterized protein n=1 Tax=Eiseniibacteriota bacterium TaxID=2212470 RepID=A0A933SDP8_UNCEI|nr:hypothetical protein [Candidatus Eisenbacteria bacterium]
MLARSLPEWMIHAFRVPYPTSRWERTLAHDHEVDFVKGSLSGVALGEDVERLSFLGPADSAGEACAGVFGYNALGLALMSDGGKLASITVLLTGSPGGKHAAFAGIFRVRDNRHVLPPETTEAEIVTLFGEPAARAEQKDDETGEVWERSLRYVNGPVLCEVVFDPEGALIEINLEPSGET